MLVDRFLISGEILSAYYGIFENGFSAIISITKTGSIYAQSIAINMGYGVALNLVNDGHIESFSSYAFLCAQTNDSITNTGFIGGVGIYMGAGNDTFSNFGGIVRSLISLQDGNDSLVIDTGASGNILFADGGLGYDSLDVSNAASAVWVDLQYSAMEVWTSGTGIATGANANTMMANISSFEKIIGTAGSDTILGDNADNLYVYNGNFSGTADIFFGRGGVDTIDLSSLSSIWVDLNLSANEVFTSGTAVAYGYNSNQAVANLDSVERIIGTTGSDQVYGDANDNTFVSNGIALNSTATIPNAIELDRFDGRGGSDTIDVSSLKIYGAIWAVWVDLTYAGPQVWTAYGQAFANGGNANLAIAQLTAVENVVGTYSTDQFFGDGSDNTYFYNGKFSGTEIFDGRGGSDTFNGSLSDTSLWIGLQSLGMEVWSVGTVANSTGANANTAIADLVSVENLVGSQYGDSLLGDNFANRIEGGKGDDVLAGYGGADTFIFNFDVVNGRGVGTDTINDFAAGSAVGHDVIQLSGYGTNFDTFAELMLNTTNTATGVHIQFSDGSIDLLGLVKAQLTVDDFVFV